MNISHDRRVIPGMPLHVVPVADLIEHDIDTPDGCVCGSLLEEGWLMGADIMIHHALDGRELAES